uniref:Uncharacterized protein n=1 Tax=Romanomermis culicivorax TaxID=13658 RepID=A0A915HQ84_ROMCU
MQEKAVATFKLAEEQTSVNFYCPPNFSNRDDEPEPVLKGWYPWIERKISRWTKKSHRKS